MGSHKKVTAQEILDEIGNNGSLTIGELANIFDVCRATVRSRVNELREDGEGIFHNKDGLFIMKAIVEKKDQDAFEKYLKWLLGAFKGIAKCGKVTKPLLLESKVYMREQLTKSERKVLTNYTAQVNRILSNIEFEDDLE